MQIYFASSHSPGRDYAIDELELSILERSSNSSMLFPDSFASFRSFLNR